ncbi:MAG: transcription antitermination factor NusB [Oscillospiraceae bacterium]|jgi:N utilization substance protein B|nr:transcription antitermination factor NusB [Oscillospiraceae bacterium]
MTRSHARELAAHLIYELDFTQQEPQAALETRLENAYYACLAEENAVYTDRPSKKQLAYISACVSGVMQNAQKLDALIKQYAIGWNLHRISRLTKAAMRLAIYEMLYVADVPTGVAINECVELTRKYEDEEVVSFVNGILGSVARDCVESPQEPEEQQ